MSQTFVSPQQSELTANEERRASPRYPTDLKVRWNVFPGNSVGSQDGAVRDISTLGVGLILTHRVELSTFLEIELLDRHGHAVKTLQARVVHVEEELPGQWLIGCAFIGELSREELAVFKADVVQPVPSDHRRWTRFPCNVETVCYTSETVPGERRSGRILNVSAGGVGLLLRCSFTQGTLLTFELPTASGDVTPMLIRVVRVMEHTKGNWFLGCEFAAQIQDDELHQLVGY